MHNIKKMREISPDFKPGEKEIDEDDKKLIISKVKGLFIHRLSSTSRNTLDSIIIAAYLGLNETAMYTNYYYIVNSIAGIVTVFNNSLEAGVGNSIVLENTEKNYKDLSKMDFFYMWIVGWCSTCLLCLLHPFMTLWVGSKLTLALGTELMFILCFYAARLGDTRHLYSSVMDYGMKQRYMLLLKLCVIWFLIACLGKYGEYLA